MTQYRVTAGVLGAPHSIQAALGGRSPGDEFEGEVSEEVVQSGAVEVVDGSEEEPSESGTEAEPEPAVEPEPEAESEPEPAGEPETGDAGEQQPGGDEADRERDELGRFVAHDESGG